MQIISRKNFCFWRRFAALCALLLLCAGALYWDAKLKDGVGAGFAPDNALALAYVADMSAAWGAWEATLAANALEKSCPHFLHELAVGVRKSAGIRPTPLRVEAWLGKGALAGLFRDEAGVLGWGLCIRPGLLLHSAHILNRILGAAPVGDVFRFRDWHYAWREGLLIVSQDEAYVLDALNAGVIEDFGGAETAALYARWKGEHAGKLTLRLDAPLGFETDWLGDLPEKGKTVKRESLEHANGDALFFISGAAPQVYYAWIMEPARPWHEPFIKPALAMLQPWVDSWINKEAIAGLQVDAFSFSLYGATNAGNYPVPRWMFSVYTPAPMVENPLVKALNEPKLAPFAWNDKGGFLAPMAGTAWTFAFQGKENVWHCASQESTMAQFLDGQNKGEETLAADLSVRLNWKLLGATVNALAYRAAEDELLPWNVRELPELLSPWLAFLDECGAFEMSATSSNGHVIARGSLNTQGAIP